MQPYSDVRSHESKNPKKIPRLQETGAEVLILPKDLIPKVVILNPFILNYFEPSCHPFFSTLSKSLHYGPKKNLPTNL